MNIGDVVFYPEQDTRKISDRERIKNRFPDRDLVITKRYIDARHGKLKLCYRLEENDLAESEFRRIKLENEALPFKNLAKRADLTDLSRPVIVGFGPAGMFAAYVLSCYGLRPLVLERGRDVASRVIDVEDYNSGKKDLDPESNIVFGEGGAGTFSDGKLYTGIGSGLKAFVGQILYENGANYEICYDSHPHIGTDNLRRIVSSLREKIEKLGGEILFDSKLIRINKKEGKLVSVVYESNGESFEIPAKALILGIGHSATDTMRSLYADGIAMEAKSFSVGVRIEHLRADIDKALYGTDTDQLYNISGANYKMAVDSVTRRKLYTFCMCPGGVVVSSSAFDGHIVTNGMSYYARNRENSNSALLVPVTSEDFGSGVFDGLEFRESLEKRAYELAGSNGRAPCMTFGDLDSGMLTEHQYPRIVPTYSRGVAFCDLRDLFPDYVTDTLVDGIKKMGKIIKGFDTPDAVLTAPETGSSSPVRILRDKDTYQSISCPGLFPSGEGAGYAGGIVSSAVDGINCANALVKYLFKK